MNKCCRAIDTENECRTDALSTVEDAFKFVPEQAMRTFRDDPTEYEDLPYASWRKLLGDPRYDTTTWGNASPMRHYKLILPYAQSIITIMRKETLATGSLACMPDLNDLKLDVEEPHGKRTTKEAHEERVTDMRSLNHLLTRYLHRYEILIKLVIAQLLEHGFYDGYDYHVEDFLNGTVKQRENSTEFGCDSTSWREGCSQFIFWLVDLMITSTLRICRRSA